MSIITEMEDNDCFVGIKGHNKVNWGSEKMNSKKLKTILIMLVGLMLQAFACEGAEPAKPVKVLLLPKFEIGEMCGDNPGEAQFFYEHYLTDSERYEVKGISSGLTAYYKNGILLCVIGEGKTHASSSLTALLLDERFDFSKAYLFSVGCAGSPVKDTVMGDVFVITSAVDYDLGGKADVRDLADKNRKVTWFRQSSFDKIAYKILNHSLTDKAYSLVKDVQLSTTSKTLAVMKKAFGSADWAVRNPMVLKGTTVTSDSYWKGYYGEENARAAVKSYACPEGYVSTEMEDIAVATIAERFSLLDRLLIIRGSVNMDVFLTGDTAESIWLGNDNASILNSENNADIFNTAMKNNFLVCRVLIDEILKNGSLGEHK